jgi:hypothetical protein
LLNRYPDQASHDLARQQALDLAGAARRASELRIGELQRARKPLLDEAEFYAGRSLSGKLKSALDANDAALAAQKSLGQNLADEELRIDRNFSAELERLRRLWAPRPVR